VVKVRFKTCMVMGACPHFPVMHWEMACYWMQSFPENATQSLKLFVVWNADLKSDMKGRKITNPKEGPDFAASLQNVQFGVFHADFRLLSLHTIFIILHKNTELPYYKLSTCWLGMRIIGSVTAKYLLEFFLWYSYIRGRILLSSDAV
jgi:hypothetical protein